MEIRRKCRWIGCATRLNRYNENACCSIHQLRWVESMKRDIHDLDHEIACRKRWIKEAKKIPMHLKMIEKFKKKQKSLKKELAETYRTAAGIKLRKTRNFND